MDQNTGKSMCAEGMPRRAFIGGAAAVSAFAIMKPATALGSQANSRIECGIIGQGGRGRMIANMVKEHGGFQIASVADYFPDVSDRAGEELSVVKRRRFSGLLGYQKLLEHKVDAVFLETPPYCFPEHVDAAVKAGCHVYIAKPVACDVPGCLAIRDAVKRSTAAHKVFLADFQARTEPLAIEGINRLHRGELGKFALLSSIYTDEGFDDPPLTGTIEDRLQHLVWVHDENLGGSFIVNCDIHAIDVALWIAQATPINAIGHARVARPTPHGDSADVYAVMYRFADGLILSHRSEHLKNKTDFSSSCVAYGQNGYLETAYAGRVQLQGINVEPIVGDVKGLYTQGALRNIDTFHKSIANGVYDNPTGEPAVNATLTTILGREAAKRGALITWDEMIRENTRLAVDTTGLTL